MSDSHLDVVPLSTTHPPVSSVDLTNVPISLQGEYRRIAQCRTSPAGYNVRKGKIFLRRCKSRLCPVCNQIRLNIYRNFVQDHMLRCHSDKKALLSLSLTISHDPNESLKDQLHALKLAWSHLTKKGFGLGRGIHFYASIVEFGDSGGHAHMHVAVAHDRDQESMVHWLRERWERSCDRLDRKGKQVDAQELTSEHDVKRFARYISDTRKATGIQEWPTRRQLERLAIPLRWKGISHTRVPSPSKEPSDWLSISTLYEIITGRCDDAAMLDLFAFEYPRIAEALRNVELIDLANEVKRVGALAAESVDTPPDVTSHS